MQFKFVCVAIHSLVMCRTLYHNTLFSAMCTHSVYVIAVMFDVHVYVGTLPL